MAKRLLAELLARLGEDFAVEVQDVCPSTNTVLVARAKSLCAPHLLVAKSQSAGRGRLGRTFFSPEGSGVYFSLLLRPEKQNDPTLITALAALCVCEAAEELGAGDCAVKWVNDVYKNGKKCCGILTQGVFEGETLHGTIIGIGANLTPPKDGFPSEFAARAGTFFEEEQDGLSADFIALVCRKLVARQNEPASAFLSDYRAKNLVLDRRVEVVQNEVRYLAVCRAVDDACRLVVEDEFGALHTLNHGEVSLIL